MPAPKGHPNYNIDKIGRPRTYDDEFIEKEAIAFYEWMHKNEGVYFKEFAFIRGYSPSKFIVFAKRNKNFCQALEDAHEWQEMRLARGGLTREFDSNFTKFVMARTCGWRDEKNVNITSTGPVPEWIAEAQGKSKDLIDDKS